MPAIVSEELFENAQKRFRQNAHKAKTPADEPAPRYWLTGKLFCGHCGASMHGTAGTSKRGRRYYYYSCINHYKKKTCDLKDVSKDKLESLVISILDTFLSDSENLASLAVDVAKYYENHYGDDSYIKALESSLMDTEKALGNIVKALEMGIFSKTTQARLQELEQQKKGLLAAIETERIKKLAMKNDHSIKKYFEMYKNTDFKDLTTRDFVFDYFVEKIFVYSDRIVICCKYDDMKDITVDFKQVTETIEGVLDGHSLSDKTVLEMFAEQVISEHGHIDYLINNALPLMKGINECSYEEFQYAMSIGVTAPFYLSKLFAPHFNKGGSIINISSSRDRMSQPQTESYTAAKGGIASLTHALAVSLSGKVRVNSISPGWIDTAYTVYDGPDAYQQPCGRVGDPLDIANMVLFLCSEKAGFITGENICIDGGMTKLMIYHGDNGWKLE